MEATAACQLPQPRGVKSRQWPRQWQPECWNQSYGLGWHRELAIHKTKVRGEPNDNGVDALVQSVPHALPVQTLIDEHGNEQRVDNGDSSGLGSGKHTADNAEHHDDDSGQCPDGSAQLLDKSLDAEGITLGVVALDRDDIGADHQHHSFRHDRTDHNGHACPHCLVHRRLLPLL